jgi:hypothetical protein
VGLVGTVATVVRSEARLTVAYDGAPQFWPIDGTPLQYAINAPTPVVRVDLKTYYALSNGVWFVAPAPLGPWVVATVVPANTYRAGAERWWWIHRAISGGTEARPGGALLRGNGAPAADQSGLPTRRGTAGGRDCSPRANDGIVGTVGGHLGAANPRAGLRRLGGEPVVRRAVVPEDLTLARLGDRQPEERLHRPGKL